MTDELNAVTEFADDPEGVESAAAAAEAAATADAAEKAVAKAALTDNAADVADLKAKYAAALADIAGLKSSQQILGQIRELFTGKPTDPKEAFLQSEIRKRVPELNDIAQIKELLPAILGALKVEADERLEEKVENATEILKGLVGDLGLDGDDAETVGYIEEAVSREIRGNEELLKAWKRGNVRGAVNKAFEKIQAKLFAPVRTKAKRAAAMTIIESPKASTPRGGGPGPRSGETTRKLDLRDTSREGVKKIHDAAFERLQELTDG